MGGNFNDRQNRCNVKQIKFINNTIFIINEGPDTQRKYKNPYSLHEIPTSKYIKQLKYVVDRIQKLKKPHQWKMNTFFIVWKD